MPSFETSDECNGPLHYRRLRLNLTLMRSKILVARESDVRCELSLKIMMLPYAPRHSEIKGRR